MKRFLYLIAFIFVVTALPADAATGKVLDVQVIKSKEGIEAWLVEDKTVPVISVNFSFEGGLAFDPEDKPGVGRLVSILLDEGAGDLDAQTFQKRLSDNAINMSYTAGRDAFYGSLRTLKSNKDLAFDLLHLALSKPRFDPDALTRMKNANVSQIKDDMGDPSWLSARTFNGVMFSGHYYARPGYGNLESMESISRRDLLDYVRAQFGRNVLKVAIAGDITKEEAAEALDRMFGGLPEKAETVDTSKAELTNTGKTILLPLDTPQTYIIAGQSGISRKDKDWHAASVVNYILGGGGFDSRLMKEVREKRGLTYGIYSSLNNLENADVLQVNLSASNEKVEEALKLMREEWKKMAEKGATEKELQDAKSYLTGSLLLSLTSTQDIAETLNSIQRDNEGPDYINRRNALINALTIADINKTAARMLKPEEITTVLVGKPQNINVDILLDRPPGMGTEEKATR